LRESKKTTGIGFQMILPLEAANQMNHVSARPLLCSSIKKSEQYLYKHNIDVFFEGIYNIANWN